MLSALSEAPLRVPGGSSRPNSDLGACAKLTAALKGAAAVRAASSHGKREVLIALKYLAAAPFINLRNGCLYLRMTGLL